MVKMASDIDETRNHRIRGIIPTDDSKYLFVEISQGNRPDIQYTSLSQKEYKNKYPYQEYIWLNDCFRVDIPEDYFNSYTKEFAQYDRHPFYNYEYTKENIVKLLQKFNKDIHDIELTDEYYLDKFCEEKGFFRLYDNRLKHFYEPTEIKWSTLEKESKTIIKGIYTCWATNGTKYSEEQEKKTTINEMIADYGKEETKKLVDKYVEKRCDKSKSLEIQEDYKKSAKELFEEKTNDIEEIYENDNMEETVTSVSELDDAREYRVATAMENGKCAELYYDKGKAYIEYSIREAIDRWETPFIEGFNLDLTDDEILEHLNKEFDNYFGEKEMDLDY